VGFEAIVRECDLRCGAEQVDGCNFRFEHGGWNDGNAADRDKVSEWPEILDRFVALADSVGGS
jgi:hypothetical protein